MPERLVGIDIGHQAVRAIALVRSGGGWVVSSHAALPRNDASGEPRPLPVLLSELDDLVGLRKGAVTVSDSTHPILVRFVSTIPMPPDRLAKLLRLELAQHADAGGELAADAWPVPLSGDELIHGCAMAQPATVHAFLADIAQANVRPRRIHFGAAALWNATIPSPPLSGDELGLIVDIGAAATRVALIGADRQLAFRQLAVGGDDFTKAVAQSRTIPTAKAEQLKQHWALAQAEEQAKRGGIGFEKSATIAAAPASTSSLIEAPADGTAATVLEEHDDEHFVLLDDEHHAHAAEGDTVATAEHAPIATGEAAAPASPVGDRGLELLDEAQPAPPAEPALRSGPEFGSVFSEGIAEPGARTLDVGGATLGAEMTRVAETLYAQLAASVNWFGAQLQTDRPKIAKVFLCGGGAALTGLSSYLQRRFGVPVTVLDPCVGLSGALPDQPHEYVAAIGLALSELPDAVRLDLLPESVVRHRLWRERLVWPFVAAAALLLAAGLGAWTLLTERAALAESLANIESYTKTEADLTRQLGEAQADREALASDLRTIASRIYFNRDLLYVIRVLKEQAPQNAELWVTRLQTVKPEPARAESTTTGGGRLGGGGSPKPAKAEATVVDRGAIEIEGRVKFDRELKPEELNKYFEDYMRAVEGSNAGATGEALFDTTKTVVFKHWMVEEKPTPGQAPKPGTKRANTANDGSAPFGIRLYFRPTDLDRATQAADAEKRPTPPAPDATPASTPDATPATEGR